MCGVDATAVAGVVAGSGTAIVGAVAAALSAIPDNPIMKYGKTFDGHCAQIN